MNKATITMLGCLFLGLLIALTQPFQAYGDGIKPGLGDLMNGGIGMLLLLAAGVIAMRINKKRQN